MGERSRALKHVRSESERQGRPRVTSGPSSGKASVDWRDVGN